MSMAIAVKNSTEATSASEPRTRLLRASVVGAVYVAACIAVIAFGVPWLWKTGMTPWITQHLGSFFDAAGLIVVLVTAAAGLAIAGLAMAGPHPPEGLRAGVFTILAGALVLFLAAVWIGQLLQHYVIKVESARMIGLALTIVLGVAGLVAAAWYALKPAFTQFLLQFEHQGWFHAKAFKPSQGRLVRRLTMVAILVLAGSGIWSLTQHNMLRGNWVVHIPFTQTAENAAGLAVTLLPDIQFTVPLILAAAGLWVAWRAVNFPTFADFLIATEAEMNKVSWTNRRRLVQDTIVVLVTVFLFSIFLLAVDQLWGWGMTAIGVVPKPPANTSQVDNTRETPW
jgi:preprotein translocase SecE subunit